MADGPGVIALVPVGTITGARIAELAHLRRPGCERFIEKPFSTQALTRKLRNVLEART